MKKGGSTKNFILTLILVIALLVFSPLALAVESRAGVVVPGSVIAKVEYILPYPGILPDHPLYALKQIRDRILDWLIVDPVRKIEFYILQADKRLGMGVMLSEAGKSALAETTISKGEKYMDRAIATLAAVKSSGKTVPGSVIDRLEKSLGKHVEVLEELMLKASDAQKSALSGSLDLVKKLQQDLAKLK